MNEEDFGKGLGDKPDDPKDTRDHRSEEIMAAFPPPVWVEKKPEDFATYPIHEQDGSGSCVAQTLSKELEVDEFQENGVYRMLSPRSIYAFGFQPNGGMVVRDATRIAQERGVTLEFLLPSMGKNEAAMRDIADYKTDAKQVAKVYKPDNIVFCDSDIETIASVLQFYQQNNIKKTLGVGLPGWNNGTWLSAFPKPIQQSDTWYHLVTVTDFGLITGEKFLSIDNSWGTTVGLFGKQFLGVDYSPLLYSAHYTLNLKDDWREQSQTVPKPHFQWDRDLGIGISGVDVLILQKALQYLGMFPIDTIINPTGNFQGITRTAVQLFQQAYGILPVTGYVGPLTRSRLNQIFK